MSSTPNTVFANDSWQSTNNARKLRAYMALRNQEIGERIRDLRGRAPQTVIADAIGSSTRTLQTWEAGVAKPNYRYLQKLADYFHVSEGYILEGVDDRPIIEGVPEQLDGVDTKFSERVDDVEKAIGELDGQVHKFREWAERAVAQIIEERTLALARANERLVSIESKLDRLMGLVDEGLFTPRADGGSRSEQLGLGAALAAAFQANPEALQALLDMLPEPPGQSQTGA